MSNHNHDDQDNDQPARSTESMLEAALSSRHAGLRPGTGSLSDVHMRARRMTRRRTAVGAGALAAVGAIGAVAVATSGDGGDGQRIVAGTGAGPGNVDAGPAGDPGDGGFWRCTGLLGTGTGSPAAPDDDELLGRTGIAIDATSTLPDPLPSTTVDLSQATSTTTIVDPGMPSTTVDLSQATSTTVVVGAMTTTIVDPGMSTATSTIVPAPYPADEYYLRDCVYVDAAGPVPDTTIPDTTIPDTPVPDTPVPDTTVVVDTTVPDTPVPDTTVVVDTAG